MALFGKKQKKESTVLVAPSVSTGGIAKTSVLKAPRITEKATDLSARSVYVFDVEKSATKREVMQMIRRLYEVTPVSVRMIRIPEKRRVSMRTGRVGVKSGGKKAYVYLKPGETISIT